MKKKKKARDVNDEAKRSFVPATTPTIKNDTVLSVMAAGDGNQDLLRNIISFVIPIDEFYAPFSDLRSPGADIRTCLEVSKSFNQVTWELMSPPIPNIISSEELIKLKKKIISLDLTSIMDRFLKKLKSPWEGWEVERYGNINSLTVLEILDSEGELAALQKYAQ